MTISPSKDRVSCGQSASTMLRFNTVSLADHTVCYPQFAIHSVWSCPENNCSQRNSFRPETFGIRDILLMMFGWHSKAKSQTISVIKRSPFFEISSFSFVLYLFKTVYGVDSTLWSQQSLRHQDPLDIIQGGSASTGKFLVERRSKDACWQENH